MGCGPIDPGSNPGGGLLGELLRLSSTRPTGRWSIPHAGCRWFHTTFGQTRHTDSIRLTHGDVGFEETAKRLRVEKGMSLQDLFRRSPSDSACCPSPFRRDTAPWPSRRAVPPRPASRGPCVDMLEMSGSETTTLGIGQAALSLPAASEALLKPPMWTCVNFLSESYISRGGGSLAWFKGARPRLRMAAFHAHAKKAVDPGRGSPGSSNPGRRTTSSTALSLSRGLEAACSPMFKPIALQAAVQAPGGLPSLTAMGSPRLCCGWPPPLLPTSSL